MSLFVAKADFTRFQPATRATFFRHLMLAGFAPVLQGQATVAHRTGWLYFFITTTRILSAHKYSSSQNLAYNYFISTAPVVQLGN
jgi:hypothetical protein